MGSNLTQANVDSPWLVAFPYNLKRSGNRNILMSFQIVSSKKVYHHQLPGVSGQSTNIICGSSGNILIMADPNSDQITLIDPSKNALFQLPPISASYSSTEKAVSGFGDNHQKDRETQQEYFVHKAVLSSPPSEYVVMVIYGERRELAYYKVGNQTWTKLQEAGCYFDDVIFHMGEFYAVDELGKVVTCKPNCPPNVQQIAMPWLLRGNKVYLASLKDYFCVVVRFLKDNPDPTLGYKTYKFEVQLLNWSGESRRIQSIEDWALFLGLNESAALSTKTIKGLKRNCIYFTDDNWERSKYGVVVGGHDSGVFDIGEESFQPLQCCTSSGSIWLIPK